MTIPASSQEVFLRKSLCPPKQGFIVNGSFHVGLLERLLTHFCKGDAPWHPVFVGGENGQERPSGFKGLWKELLLPQGRNL